MRSLVCFFEDKKYSNFFPLSLSQPVFELRIGCLNLRLRSLETLTPRDHGVICREYLAPTVRLKYPGLNVNDIDGLLDASKRDEEGDEGIIFLNGRLLCYGDELEELLRELPANSMGVKGGYVAAARLSGEAAEAFGRYIMKRISEQSLRLLCEELKRFSQEDIAKGSTRTTRQAFIPDEPAQGSFEDDHQVGQDEVLEKMPRELEKLIEEHSIDVHDFQRARLLSFPWQIIEENPNVLSDDFDKLALRGQGEETVVSSGVHMIDEEMVVLGESVLIKPGTVLDASGGPIVIGDGTTVMANASINGPVYIGKNCLVKPGAKILEGTSIGDVCKIGGEVDACIFAAYSNKQHEGFLGHSYIGEWVNIGAGTNNSDLKNNYSPVRMWCAGKIRETGRQFLGFIVGDHSKTGINTTFNTGTVIGFNTSIFGSDPPGKFIPSFSWGTAAELQVYDPAKAIQTASIVMGRRDIKFERAHKELFEKVFEISTLSKRNI